MGNDVCERLWFYGERGMVNGLVLDLLESPPRFQELLRAAAWCGAAAPAWVDEIQTVTFLVEPGFSKFGQPDLVAVCALRDGDRRFVVVEVKSTTYTASAMSNKSGIRSKGYNSSINGQMSLNYRFVTALEGFDFGHGTVVEESAPLLEWYRRQLSDTCPGPRRLGKPQAIQGLVRPFLRGMNSDTTHFLVLARREKKGSPANPLETVDPDFRPLLLEETGEDAWVRRKGQFGFLSLETLDLEVLATERDFRRQCRLYLGPWDESATSGATRRKEASPVPKAIPRAVLCPPPPARRPDPVPDETWPSIKAFAWSQFPAPMVRAVDDLAACIRRETDCFAEHKKHAGSHSFRVRGKTVARLNLGRPEQPALRVWFSIAVPRARDYAELLGEPTGCYSVPAKQPFLVVERDDFGGVCGVVAEFLESFATGG